MHVGINLERLTIWLAIRKKEWYNLKHHILLNGANALVNGLKLLYMEKEKRHKVWHNLHPIQAIYFKFMV